MKRIKAEKIRVGDTIIFNDARFNLIVEDIRENSSGDIWFSSNNDTKSMRFDSDELVTVIRGNL
jgi:ASC-1-like (ASCH) protein